MRITLVSARGLIATQHQNPALNAETIRRRHPLAARRSLTRMLEHSAVAAPPSLEAVPSRAAQVPS
jgi:hypothetical protein